MTNADRGISQLDKYKRADFGRCPRVLCYQQPLLPVGLSDLPFQKAVKLFCPRCEDIYSPKSSRHGTIDGAFFGSTFPHMLVSVSSSLLRAVDADNPYSVSLVHGIPTHATFKVTYITVTLFTFTIWTKSRWDDRRRRRGRSRRAGGRHGTRRERVVHSCVVSSHT